MVGKISYWIKQWEKRCYKGGLPDDIPNEIFYRAPSYKRIVLAIMKNDDQLQLLGFSKRDSIYYRILKRKELKERGVIKESNQLKLFSHENILKERNSRKN